MRLESGARRRGRRNWATLAIVEVVAALVASAIMALMVVGGGLAVERTTSVQSMAEEEASGEPGPLSWR